MRCKWAFYSILSIVMFFCSWELISLAFKGTPLIFPSPIHVFTRVVSEYSIFGYHLFYTFLEMFFGMVIAIIVSFCIAYAMFKLQIIKAILQPYFVIMQCIPMFTLAPIFIIWFGWSFIAIIIPTAMMIAFPLTMSIYKGLHSASQQYIDFFTLHGASERLLLFKLKLPFALPQIFAGLRIASAIAGIGAIGGEWAGAQQGLGVFMQVCRRNFDLEGVFGCIFCLLLLSLTFYAIIIGIEKYALRGNHEKFKMQVLY